ncbi:SDR family oxidoreductase [Streptomyces sp. NPDC023327]|uniref:SDR family oxidoreductase n=1 Tax=Streptomyces sp. NPDC023327 TaxID=3157088 RepID=UPI0033F5CF2E
MNAERTASSTAPGIPVETTGDGTVETTAEGVGEPGVVAAAESVVESAAESLVESLVESAPHKTPKVAVVTGAGSGIGRAVAVELLAAGWSVALAGRRVEALEETAALAVAKDGATLCVRTDVSRPEDVAALFTGVRERFGRLDLLFNNAGTFGPGGVPVEELPYDAWRHVVDTNLNGAFLCAQAAFRQMKEQLPQGGRIINNGSISAHAPRPHSVAYTATKHALTGLTKSLSLDGRPYRIAVGQIDIGNAATDMTARMQSGVPQADGRLASEPVMDVADVARTVRHMAELPLEANVQFATVLATTMPYIGRG